MAMIQKQIHIRSDQDQFIKARVSGTPQSESDFIREMIDFYIANHSKIESKDERVFRMHDHRKSPNRTLGGKDRL